MPSFDVVSQVDMQEVTNAVNQTRKEIAQRYDFKGVTAEVTLEGNELVLLADTDHKVKAVVDVLQSKLVRRGVDLQALRYGTIEGAGGGKARQRVAIQQGIDTERARQIVKTIKGAKLKVQAQVQGDQVRVSGKKRDDLQAVIQQLRGEDFGQPLQFINFRD